MAKPQNLAGRRFDRLHVVERIYDENNKPTRYYLCKCDCGQTKFIKGSHLVAGATKSCGCLRREVLAEMKTVHGHCRSKIRTARSKAYRAWESMLRRCNNPSDRAYRNYGGRGIKACPEWHDFPAFLRDMGEPPIDRSLDRIDTNGDYHPDNCRWADNITQCRNRRNVRMITADGFTGTIPEWEERMNFRPGTISRRILSGWDPARACTAPVLSKRNPHSRNA